MKSLTILQTLLQDASRSLDAKTTADWITIQQRTKTEGLSFLTLSLPIFGDWFFQALENRKIATPIGGFFGLKRSKGRKSVLPCFLYGLTSLVFDTKSGELLYDENHKDFPINAVFFIRQICYSFKKVELQCSRKRVIKAFLNFKEVDRALRASDRSIVFSRQDKSILNILSSRIFSKYLDTDSYPKHGPGATFEGIRGNSKYKNRVFYRRWAGIFSWEDLYGFSTINQEENKDEEESVPTVKVIAVPKTQKGPRIIAVEPVAMQYAQQLVSRRIISSFNRSPYSSMIKFEDQTCNQKAAEFGSRDRSNCTIDLSEASDRISCKLVRSVLSGINPVILKQIFATRSPRAYIPELGTYVNLRKFASMGSAVTFPLESIIFLMLVLMLISRTIRQERRVSLLRSLKLASEKVLIFGDDIIVPREFCSVVIDGLETYGLKVNRKKTFSNGYFRESCGVDAFRGYNITPIYVRRLLPYDNGRTPESIVSTVSLSNRMFFAGLPITADYLAKEASIPLPLVGRNSPILGLHTRQDAYQFDRFDGLLHRYTCRGFITKIKHESDSISGYDALLKFQLSAGIFEDKQHLDRNVKRFSLSLRQSRTTPY